MARPESFTKSIQLRVDQDFLDDIDAWQEERGHKWSRSEAIRTLVNIGLKNGTAPGEHINEVIQHYHKVTEKLQNNLDPDDTPLDVIINLSATLLEVDKLASKISRTVEDRQLILGTLSEMRSQTIQLIEKITSGGNFTTNRAS